MSTAQHEAAARQEEQAAAQHQQQYYPAAGTRRMRCLDAKGRPGAYIDTGACWSSVTNPIEEHLRSAEEHRRRSSRRFRSAAPGGSAGLRGTRA